MKTFEIQEKGKLLVSGLAIGSAIAVGKVCRLKSAREGAKFPDGGILVDGNDRPRLGADHEARRSHCHGAWRENFACRDRQPRDRITCRRRREGCHSLA